MIREAVRADIPSLIIMGLHFIRSGSYAGHLDENPDALFDTMLRLIDSEDAILLVQGDETPVGMIGAVLFAHPLSRQTFVSELFWWVEPEHRGDGMAMLRAVEQWARDCGAVKLQMIAPDERTARAYQALGFSKLEELFQKEL